MQRSIPGTVSTLTLSLVAAALLAALPPLAPTAIAAQAPLIEGFWQLVEVPSEDGLALVAPGITAKAFFWQGDVRADAGCGEVIAAYHLSKDEVKVDPLGSSPGACDDDTRQVESIFFDSMAKVASWSVDGATMLLSDADGAPLLRFTSAEIPQDVTIAPWSLARLAAAGAALSPVIGDSQPTLTFLPGGRVVGETGCGSVIASYGIDDTDIHLSSISSREHDCDETGIAQAREIVNALSDTTTLNVRPAGLTLLDGSDAARLSLAPEIPLEGRNWTPTEILDQDGHVVVSTPDLEASVLRFKEAGGADGRMPCHAFTASSLRSGLAVSLFDIAAAKCTVKATKKLDKAFRSALGTVASQALRGSRLDLLDKEGDTVVRLVAQPPLEGQPWVLSMLERPKAGKPLALRAVTSSVPITARFDDGLVSGFTGCTDYSAGYLASSRLATSFDAEKPQRTPRNCADDVELLEAQFLNMLSAADGFVVLPDGLRLLVGDRVVAQFAPAQARSQAFGG